MRLFSRVSIALRLIGLAFTLVGIMFGISLFLTRSLDRAVNTAIESERLLAQIDDAHAVGKAFADLRYWLADLSVGASEQSAHNVAAARLALRQQLSTLARFEPDLVEAIRHESAVFDASAQAAVDAYADNRRDDGNASFAAARGHGQQVDALLDGLEQRLTAQEHEIDVAIVAARGTAAAETLLAIVAAVLLAAGLTVLVLRSFLVPLSQLVAAVEATRRGDLTARLPPASRDELGAMTRAVQLFREGVAERARLEREAEAQRQLLSDAIEWIGEGFVLYDEHDRLTLWNSNFVRLQSGLADLILQGTPFRVLVEAAASRGLVDLPTGEPSHWVAARLAQHRAPDGAIGYRFGDKWLQISERHMTDGGTVAIYSDITELRRRQEELEAARQEAVHASQVKSEFLANMSHELRTPLNAIIGYSQLLQEEAADTGEDAALPDLRKIEAAGKHLLGLINGILDLSKIEAGRMDLFIEALDVAALVEDVRLMVAPLAARNGNTLSIDCPAGIGAIRSDVTKLKQSLLNLLGNACKFTENGTVAVTVRRNGQGLVSFAVADTGIGMTEDQIGKLFQAFVQVDNSTTKRFGGTGLGLALTRSFVRMLGGEVTVSSRAGAGSTFTLLLPADQAPPARAPANGAEPGDGVAGTLAGPTAASRILVVDDDAAARQIIGAYLAREGYQVLYAESGGEGLDKARDLRPDAITLDIMMPQIDGWSVLTALKADPELRHIPVVLVSVAGDKGLAFSLGAAASLSKPVNRADLIAALQGQLQVRSNAVVLVVEDDVPTRELTRRTVESLGHACVLAPNGREALDWLMVNPMPAMILLDLLMPEMDGFEFLHRLRERAEWRDLPVVVVTAKQFEGAERQVLEAMAQQVVAKGHSAHRELARAVRAVLLPATVD